MGKKSQKTTVQNQPPKYIQQAYQNLIPQIQQTAALPLQQYQGNIVAPFSDLQNTAFGQVANVPGIAQPYIDQAMGLAQAGTQAATPQQWSPNAIQQYENPFTQDVIGATQAQFNLGNAQQQNSLLGNIASQHALGGDRSAIAQAALAGQQQAQQAPVIAGLEQANYQQATGEFNTQQQTALAAAQANAYRNLYGSGEVGNLGELARGTDLTGIGAELNAGGLQQQEQQAQLNVPYEQFLQRQQYPFYTTQYETGLESALAPGAGGTQTSTAPGPNLFGQLGGLGLSFAGLGGFEGAGGAGPLAGAAGSIGSAFTDILPFLGLAAKGGRIGYAEGGEPDDGLDDEPFDEQIADNELAGIAGVGMNAVPQGGIAAAGPSAPVAPPVSAPTTGPSSPMPMAAPKPNPVRQNEELQGIEREAHPMDQVGQDTASPPSSDQSLNPLGLDDSHNAMLQAGLGMMTSPSHTFLGAVGQGGLTGLQAFQRQKALEAQMQYRHAMSQAALERAENQGKHYSNIDSAWERDDSGDTIHLIQKSTGKVFDTHIPTTRSEAEKRPDYVPTTTGVDAHGNPEVTMVNRHDPSDTRPIAGSPLRGGANGRGQTATEWKYNAYLAVHPNDRQGALDYAGGHKQITGTDAAKIAMQQATLQANKQNFDTPEDYNAFLSAQYQKNLKMLEAANTQPQGNPAPQAAPPAATADQLQQKLAGNAVAHNPKGAGPAAIIPPYIMQAMGGHLPAHTLPFGQEAAPSIAAVPKAYSGLKDGTPLYNGGYTYVKYGNVLYPVGIVDGRK